MSEIAPGSTAEAAPASKPDYHAILARAVAGLARNSDASRRAIFERARATLSGQLRALDPPLEEAQIMQERLLLEAAITSIESEAVQGPERADSSSAGAAALFRMDNLGRLTLYAVAALVACALAISLQPDLTRWVMMAGLIGWVGLHAWQSRRGSAAYTMAGLVLVYVAFDLFQGCSARDAVEGAGTAGLLAAAGFAAGHRDR